MASLIDELIDVLEQENKEYETLKLLSKEKTPVIVKGRQIAPIHKKEGYLQYALSNGKRLDELDLVDESANKDGSEINYSVRNCDTRLKGMEEYLQMELPEETRAILVKMRDELLENRGKGFIKRGNDAMDIPIVGDSCVEKMYIITDSGCGSSGDNFVAVFSMFPKVTVVGRPTMGILD